MALISENVEFNGDNSRKIGLSIGVVVIVLVSLGLIYLLLGNKYEVMFSELEGGDLDTVISELEKQGIEYKIDSRGAVLVKDSQVHQARLMLMESEAKLRGGVGFELFDTSDFGMTEFVQKINYQRALRGELTRTISSLDEVKFARVHLVLPQNSLFSKDDRPARASVTLFTNENKKLTKKQVFGIQRLVAAAVPDMLERNVTITNQRGETLSVNELSSEGEVTFSDRLNKQKEVEDYFSQKIDKVLAHTFGKEKASVSVNVELDMDMVKTTREKPILEVNGEKAVLRFKETKSIPEGKKKTASVTRETDYKLGKNIEHIVKAPGVIKNISVGVIVPAKTSEIRLEQIRELVGATVGVDETRGDKVVVKAIALPKRPINEVRAISGNIDPFRNMTSGVSDFREEKPHPTSMGIEFVDKAESPGSLALQNHKNDTGFDNVSVLSDIIVSMRNSENLVGLLVVLLLSISLLGLIYTTLRSRVKVAPVLSEHERMRVLAQLNEWIESDKRNR